MNKDSDLGNMGLLRNTLLQDVLHDVGRKWALEVLGELHRQSLRFNTIRHDIPGVSQRSLSLIMHALQRDGLVNRTIFPVVPPRVDYELTDLGRSLIEALGPIAHWSRSHREQLVAAQMRYDSNSNE